MNEDAYAKEMITVLDGSLPLLRPEITEQLRLAREQACARAMQGVYAHSSAGHSMTWTDWVRQHRLGLAGMLLVLALGGGTAVWQSGGNAKDDNNVNVDTELLTGDLPVNAYLDGHLSKWVSNSSAY